MLRESRFADTHKDHFGMVFVIMVQRNVKIFPAKVAAAFARWFEFFPGRQIYTSQHDIRLIQCVRSCKHRAQEYGKLHREDDVADYLMQPNVPTPSLLWYLAIRWWRSFSRIKQLMESMRLSPVCFPERACH